MKRQSGQALVLAIVTLPLLIFLGGIVVRSGKSALIHSKIQNHCDKKVLDAAKPLAEGLEALGRLNTKCRTTIIARRAVEVSIAAASVSHPEAVPELIKVRRALVATQDKISVIQKTIITVAISKSQMILAKKVPTKFGQKISEKFNHLEGLKLFVKQEHGYEGEVGAPLVLDDHFDKRQNIDGSVKIQTERFLEKWKDIKKSPNMTLNCKAQVVMDSIESSWTVALREPDRPSLRQLWY